MTHRDVQFLGLGMVAATAVALATQLLLIQQQVHSRVVVLLLVVLLGIALAVVGDIMGDQ